MISSRKVGLFSWLTALSLVLAGCGVSPPPDEGASLATESEALFAGTKINSGASAVAPYAADSGYSGGSTFSSGNTINTSAVSSPAPMAVYQTSRFGTFSYTLGGFVAGSSHRVRLHFAETVQNAAGGRVFNVSINGVSALASFDIFQAAGGKYKAVVREFVRNANSSGQYVLSFTAITGQPMVSGIEIVNHTRYLASDYDSDGKADHAYFSPADNLFHVRKSSDAGQLTQSGAAVTDVFVPGDYDGDGRTDYGYFRPAEGNWYAKLASGATFTPIAHGSSTDRLVPGDYDGDGKTDPAYFRLSDATWNARLSGGGTKTASGFGTVTDIMVPADYDGDDKTDFAFYRRTEGRWYVRPSRGGSDVLTYFGAPNDRPVPADYDGDNKADLTIFRPGEGTWYIHPSAGGADIVIPFGEAADRLEPGDYDGDGKAEPGLFRPRTNTWYAHPSSGGGDIVVTHGTSTDVQLTYGPVIARRRFNALVEGDYDGDDRADPAYFVPDTGVWTILRSGGGTGGGQFGQRGDRVFPGDFDGDRRADLALYRPSTGYWHAVPSGGGPAFFVLFGSPTDIITPGDYDGDGKTDPALFRPELSNWYAHPSSGGPDLFLPAFGNSRSIPIPADYDGDGKTDFAYYDMVDGLRHIHPSSGAADYTVSWGNSGDDFVHGDFDGDGRGDYALYRPLDGWYASYKAGGSVGPVVFGTYSDRAVPRDYDGDGRSDYAFLHPDANASISIMRSSTGVVYSVAAGGLTSIPVAGTDYGWTTAVCPGPICANSDPLCGQPGHPGCCTAAQCAAGCVVTTISCPSTPWPSGVIYYQLMDSSLQTAFNAGASAWNLATQGRLSFQSSTTRPDRVRIHLDTNSGGGGRCDIGYTGSLRSCEWGGSIGSGTATHELGHVVGFFHEQVRNDRDRFIEMIPNAFVCANFGDNISRCGAAEDAIGYGPFNMSSVMQYGSAPPYYIMDRAVGLPMKTPLWSVTGHDVSNVLELYASQYAETGRSWHKFMPLGIDIDPNKPLLAGVPAPPAIGAPTAIVGSPAIASQGGTNVLDYYVRGADGVIYHRFRSATGVWSGYYTMGGTFDTDPAATSWGTGTAIIVAGNLGQLSWKKYQNSAWGSWAPLPTLPSAMASGSSPAVVAWSPGVLHVIVRLQNNTLSYVPYTNNAWGSWAPVPPATPAGVTFTGSPTVASQGPNVLNIFTNTASGQLYHTFFSSGWWNIWENNACCLATNSKPVATSWGSGRVDVFFRATDGNLEWRYYSNGWHGNYRIGGTLTSSPAAVAPYANHIDVLGVSTDNALWHRWYQ